MNFRFLAFNWSELSKGDLSVLTTLAGLIIVFAVLIVLTLVISLLNKMGASSNKPNKQVQEPKAPASAPKPPVQTAPPVSKSVQTTEDDSLIAVIAAAVHAFGESIGQKLAVKSVQRAASRKVKDGRSAWANAGIRENTRPTFGVNKRWVCL